MTAVAKPKVVQLGVIGAMQRAHPALTQLWLQWTGIPDLDRATFDMVRPDDGRQPATSVQLLARPRVQETWTRFCDVMGVAPDATERRKMPIYLGPKTPSHAIFWSAMKHRELSDVDGPLEWWWRLLVLRYQGVQRASQALIRATIGDEPALDKGLIVLTNPALKEEGRFAKNLIEGGYKQPTHVVVTLRTSRDARHEGLAFSLAEVSFRARFISKMIDLAVTRT